MPRSTTLLLAALLLPTLSAWSAEPILVYERVHQQVAHDDNAVRLTVFDDGRVEAHFPFYSPNAGTLAWHIPPSELQALLDLASPLQEMRSEQLMQGINLQRTANLTEVSDADRVTIELLVSSRAPRRITAPSPEIWARHLPPDHAVSTFAGIAEEVSEWMRENARERQP